MNERFDGYPGDRVNRRDFMKAMIGGIGGLIGAAIGIPAVDYLVSPALQKDEESEWVNLGTLDRYPAGIPQLFQFTRTRINGWERTGVGYGVFVLREDGENVRVFSNICTHLGCHINWHPDIKHYVSPCHDGHFDIVGKNISGPPPRPLDEFVTKIEDGKLFIQLPAFRRPA